MEEEQNVITNQSDKQKHSKKGVLILGLLVVLVALAGCLLYTFKDKLFSSNTINNTVKTPVVKLKSDYRISGNDIENFDLVFMQLENNLKNKVYSPLSIKYALYMLNQAANGETKAQIDAVLGDYKVYSYPNSNNMSFANALFIKNSYKKEVLDSYVDTLKDSFDADIIFDSFSSPKMVNKWISDKTLNLLKDFFQEPIGDLDYILINALAIDMNWNYQLQCESTEASVPCLPYLVYYSHENYSDYVSDVYDGNYAKSVFNYKEVDVTQIGASINRYDIINELGEDNIRQTVSKEYQEFLDEGGYPCANTKEEYINSYMSALKSNYKKFDKSTDFLLYTSDEVKVFAKDLKTYNDKALQYVAIMPLKTDLKSYVKDIKADDISSLVKNLKEVKYENFEEGYVTKIKGTIPLFEFEYELDLLNDLKQLGIKDVFDSKKADLSKMTKSSSYIDTAVHKANITFSNDGIKASAATAFGGKGSAVACTFEYKYDVPVKEIDITFDNPYLFIIRDKVSGEVWFAGTVYEP